MVSHWGAHTTHRRNRRLPFILMWAFGCKDECLAKTGFLSDQSKLEVFHIVCYPKKQVIVERLLHLDVVLLVLPTACSRTVYPDPCAELYNLHCSCIRPELGVLLLASWVVAIRKYLWLMVLSRRGMPGRAFIRPLPTMRSCQ